MLQLMTPHPAQRAQQAHPARVPNKRLVSTKLNSGINSGPRRVWGGPVLQLMTPHPALQAHPAQQAHPARVPNKRLVSTKRNSGILGSILVSFWDQF